MKDINTIKNYIKEAEAAGKSKKDGIKDAAKHFGVTYSAVNCRMWKYEHNQNMSQLSKKNTTKIPLKVNATRRGPYKKRFNSENIVAEPAGKSISIKIKDVKIDLEKGTITILY